MLNDLYIPDDAFLGVLTRETKVPRSLTCVAPSPSVCQNALFVRYQIKIGLSFLQIIVVVSAGVDVSWPTCAITIGHCLILNCLSPYRLRTVCVVLQLGQLVRSDCLRAVSTRSLRQDFVPWANIQCVASLTYYTKASDQFVSLLIALSRSST